MGSFRLVLRMANANDERSFTETFHVILPSSADVTAIPEAQMTAIAVGRAQCLANNNMVKTIVANEVDTPKVKRTFVANVSGALGGAFGENPQDVVNVARLSTLRGFTGAKANYLQRGAADGDIVGGKFTYALHGPGPYNNWLTFMTTFPLALQGTVFGPVVAITSATTAGITPLNPADIYPVGTVLNIKTQVVGNGPKINCRVKVTGIAAGIMTVANWRWGNCVGGNLRVCVSQVQQIISATNSDAQGRTRKTGGPFSRFRGRRSRRSR